MLAHLELLHKAPKDVGELGHVEALSDAKKALIKSIKLTKAKKCGDFVPIKG